MKTVLVLEIIVLGVFVNTPATFAFSGPFVPLSSEQVDVDARDSNQSENERDVAGSDNESPDTSAASAGGR